LPGYGKDIYSFTHRIPWSIGVTVGHKLAPGLGIISDVIQNEDYSGTEIHNWDDPIREQLFDILKAGFDTNLPISYQNFRRDLANGTPYEEFFEDVAGIGNASGEVDRTEAEQKLRDYIGPIHRTEQEKLLADQRRAIRTGSAGGASEGQQSDALNAMKGGDLSQRQILNAIKASRMTWLQAGVQKLTLDRALNIYDVATPDERGMLWQIIETKFENVMQSGAPNSLGPLSERWVAAQKLPVSPHDQKQ
jgi:hypothetical protein